MRLKVMGLDISSMISGLYLSHDDTSHIFSAPNLCAPHTKNFKETI